MDLTVEVVKEVDVETRTAEIVEKKGIGHPDTLADGIAEAVSNAYSKYCLEQFGEILHHNSDKTSLLGGAAQVRFGGGELTSPIIINVNGRFSTNLGSISIPYDELIRDASTKYISSILFGLSIEKDIRVNLRASTASSPGYVDGSKLDHGSRAFWFSPRSLDDLAEVQRLHSNDTSCGVGYAPLSSLEDYVLRIEAVLNGRDYKALKPFVGTDIKIMGARKGKSINLTMSVPLIDTFVENTEDYRHKLDSVKADILRLAPPDVSDVDVNLNMRDDYSRPELYLTVTGSSIESGDEGLVGRGNRVNGLITPMRPMSIEGASGKNPVYHIGKLYNIIASKLAQRIYEHSHIATQVVLVSQTGRDLRDPWIVNVAQADEPRLSVSQIKHYLDGIFDSLVDIRKGILEGLIKVY